MDQFYLKNVKLIRMHLLHICSLFCLLFWSRAGFLEYQKPWWDMELSFTQLDLP